MTQASKRRGPIHIPLQTLAAAFLSRFDPIVSSRIRDRDERRRHAILLAVLTVAGLVAALGMPAAGLAGGSMHLVVVPAVLSSICLVLAAALIGTGAFEVVAGAAIAGATMLLAIASVRTGGIASPIFWLLPIVPIESFVAGRRALFRFCVGIASLALCLVLGAEWLGLSSHGASMPLTIAASALGVSYLLLQATRVRAGLGAARRADDIRRAELRLMETMLDKAVLRFAADGSLISASEAAKRWLGERLADERQPFGLGCVHVADRVRYLAAFGEIRAGATSAACEVRLFSGEGQRFADVCLKLAAGASSARKPGAILVVIEEKPAADDSADALQAALAEAEAMSEAKNNFLAMVSHELRTPLNAIIGFSDVLDQEFFGGFEDPRQKEYVGLIRQSGEHLLAVVNGLLDISKIEAGRYELVLEPFDLDEVLGSAVSAVKGEAEAKSLDLVVRNGCGNARPVADRRAIQQILLNLLSNAVKFTDSGRVSVTTSICGDFLELVVSDTGPGIAPSELPHLGKPFAQGSCGLARRYPGTGLGLSLVKGFAELHHGSMTLASEFGRGTTVCVKIRLDRGSSIEDKNDNDTRVVALKHGRTHENNSPTLEARRSA